MPFLQSAYMGDISWEQLWSDYGNSHRFPVAKLLWLADWQFAAASNHLLLAISFCLQCLIFLQFYLLIARCNPGKTETFCYSALSFFYLFNISQLFNFYYTFDVQWFVVTAAAVSSFNLLIFWRKQLGAAVAVAWLLALLASMNNFSGFLIFPVQLVLLIWLAYPRRFIAAYLGCFIAYALYYFSGLPAGEQNIIHTLIQENYPLWMIVASVVLVLCMVYPLTYLTSPLSAMLYQSGPWHSGWLVLDWLPQVILAGLLVVIVRQSWRQRHHLSPISLFALSIMLFCYAIAVVTGLGRSILWEIVYALRFQNIVLLFWLAMATWLVVQWHRRGLLLACALAVAVHGSGTVWQANSSLQLTNRTSIAHVSIRAGLADELEAIKPTVSRFHLLEDTGYHLADEAAFLQREKLGMFAVEAWQPPNHRERQHAIACQENLSLQQQRPLQDSVSELQFFTATPGAKAWFVYADDTLAGILSVHYSHQLGEYIRQQLAGHTGYIGMFRQRDAARLDRAYMKNKAGQWCGVSIEAIK